MKKVFISFIAMLSVVFFFISGKGYANEVVDNTVTTKFRGTSSFSLFEIGGKRMALYFTFLQ